MRQCLLQRRNRSGATERTTLVSIQTFYLILTLSHFVLTLYLTKK